ncbi:hypothetical protein E2C01_068523 [Portunus trituberculatus]|uniref:Uncharacterized protein n=1 Tax=Portunus trituberculatus TaxID=210409 RepID=A0A5B7HW42_PORTR|nr:hypothetical protein [Portunus trituberculatus]
MEVMYFRVMLADRSALLLCALYRPPRQGPVSLLYLAEALDNLMMAHSCSHVLIVRDLSHHLERDAYENLLEVQGLTDRVTFPTHERGGTLDPTTRTGFSVISWGSWAALTQLDVGVARDEATIRTIWLWNKADWASLRRDLTHTPWATLLQRGTESEALALTSHLLALQRRHVPHREIHYQTDGSAMVWLPLSCCCRGKVRCLAPLQEEPDSAQQAPTEGGMQEDGGNQQVGHKKVGGKPAPETVLPWRRKQNLVVPC